MSLGKASDKIKLYGDNIAYLKKKSGGDWFDVGNLLADVEVLDVTENVEVELNDGSVIDIDGKRKVTYTLPLLQTGKDEIDLVLDDSRNELYELAYGNGIVGGKQQVFYAGEVKIKHEASIKTADKPKKIMMMVTGQPGDANVSVANTSLPAALRKPADTTTTWTGKNKFHMVIEF